MNVGLIEVFLLLTSTVMVAFSIGLWVGWKPREPHGVSAEVVDRWRHVTSGLRELAGDNMVRLQNLHRQLQELSPNVAQQYFARITADVEQLIDNNQHVDRVLGTVHSALQQIVDKGSTAVLVRHLMSQPVQTIPPTLPAPLAAKRLVDYRIRHLLVVDQAGLLLGVLSDRDVLKHLSPWLSKLQSASTTGPLPKTVTANDLMSSTAITVRAETTLAEATALMASKRINCLPVVGNRQQPVGILTTMDVLLHVAGSRKRM